MTKRESRRGATGGQGNEPAGQLSSARKILQFRPRVNPQPAPTPAGFDIALSRRLDLLVWLIEVFQAEKARLEDLIPDREAMA